MDSRHKELILSEETFQKYGYRPEELSYGSRKKVIHKCDVCGKVKETRWRYLTTENQWAHIGCRSTKRRQTWLKKYGVDHPRKCKEVQERQRRTNIQRYGVEYPLQSKMILKKKVGTCLEKYGVENPNQSEGIQRRGIVQRLCTYLRKRGINTSVEDANKSMIEYIRSELQKERYELLSNVYVRGSSKIDVKCPKGDIYQVRWCDWVHRNSRCPICRESRHEKILGEILERIYPGGVIVHDRLGFLKYQSVDFSVPLLRVVIEYDGEQHYRPIIGAFGSKTQEEAQRKFKHQRILDKRKNQLCKKNGYTIVRIKYTEKLVEEVIKQRIDNALREVR